MITPPTDTFDFTTSGRIVFGTGTIAKLPELASPLGKKALIVCGAHPQRIATIIESLHQKNLTTIPVSIDGEPSVGVIEAAVEQARSQKCELVIGIGGGSVLDAGKAISILLTNPGDPLDYLEIIGRGKPLTHPPLPYIAVPTTAGTGTEVTANAVIESPSHRLKVSLRSPLMLPKIALIDPELTISMPPRLTAYTGLDALTQVMEPYVSHQANPMTDLFCREGLKRASQALVTAFNDGSNLEARESMSLVSLYGGLALANAKLGAVHGFAGPFGGMYKAPHGAVCAALLPHVMEANIRALQLRARHYPSLSRYREVACLLTGNRQADIMEGPAAIKKMTAAFSIPGLHSYGLQPDDMELLINNAEQASSMQGNPIKLSRHELAVILNAAL